MQSIKRVNTILAALLIAALCGWVRKILARRRQQLIRQKQKHQLRIPRPQRRNPLHRR